MMMHRLTSCSSRPAVSHRATTVKTMAAASAPPVSKTRLRRPQNVEGSFWVDNTCINCDTCRWMAPEVFSEEEGQSAVTHQPENFEGRVRAMQALLSCPTFSIHHDKRTKEELQAAQQGLPAPVPGVPGVYHCGWHSEKSAGAASFLYVREPGLGNVLVDSPRYNPVLARKLEALGGVDYLFLTHKDDVADHAQWVKHFGCVRILHQGEVQPSTRDVEVQLQGDGPWSWARDVEAHPASQAMRRAKKLQPAQQPPQDQQQESGQDMTLVHTPGHTRHHVCLFVPQLQALFSGDHLSSPEERGAEGNLCVFEDFNWFDVPTQLRSVAKLLDYDWLHVLPGHGRQARMRDAAHRLQAVSELLQRHGEGARASHN